MHGMPVRAPDNRHYRQKAAQLTQWCYSAVQWVLQDSVVGIERHSDIEKNLY